MGDEREAGLETAVRQGRGEPAILALPGVELIPNALDRTVGRMEGLFDEQGAPRWGYAA